METHKLVGIILIALSVVVALFGVWLKIYNDRIAQLQVNETGSCYLPDGTCLHTTSDSMLYAGMSIAVLLFVLGLYLILRKKEPGKIVVERKTDERNESVNETPVTLNPESRKVFDIITQSNGAVLQGEIVTRTGMDKVKVSRILDKLEMQGLIERRRHGMSNLIVLKKK